MIINTAPPTGKRLPVKQKKKNGGYLFVLPKSVPFAHSNYVCIPWWGRVEIEPLVGTIVFACNSLVRTDFSLVALDSLSPYLIQNAAIMPPTIGSGSEKNPDLLPNIQAWHKGKIQ